MKKYINNDTPDHIFKKFDYAPLTPKWGQNNLFFGGLIGSSFLELKRSLYESFCEYTSVNGLRVIFGFIFLDFKWQNLPLLYRLFVDKISCVWQRYIWQGILINWRSSKSETAFNIIFNISSVLWALCSKQAYFHNHINKVRIYICRYFLVN